MNGISAVFHWAMAHPYLASGIVLGTAGGVCYSVYKLADKSIDAVESFAERVVDRTIEGQYSFEFPGVSAKAYPSNTELQELSASC